MANEWSAVDALRFVDEVGAGAIDFTRSYYEPSPPFVSLASVQCPTQRQRLYELFRAGGGLTRHAVSYEFDDSVWRLNALGAAVLSSTDAFDWFLSPAFFR